MTDLDSDLTQAWREFSRRMRAAKESMEPILRDSGTNSLAEFEALEFISRDPNGSLPQRAVQEALGLSQSGASRLASRLERAGLLRRTEAELDARASELLLTPAGKAIVSQHRRAFEHEARNALVTLGASLSRADVDENVAEPGSETATAPGGILQFGESLLSLGSEAIAVADAIHVRDALEPLVLVEAAQYRTPEDIAQCREILLRMASLLDDGKSFYAADWSLHRRLAQICQNTLLRTVYLGVLGTLESHVDDVVPTSGLRDYLHRRVVVHTEIVDAVASGRQDLARAAANQHAITGIGASVGVAS